MFPNDLTLLKPAEVMERLGISRVQLYRWLADGTLPSMRDGRSVRIPAAELAAWIESRRQDAGLPPREEGSNRR